MKNKALVVIDIQNDITKNYRNIIDSINSAIEWAMAEEIHVVYIKHYNISEGTRTFKPGSKGAELAPELKIVSDNIFVKNKSNALTSEPFSAFISDNGISEFYVVGADATACVKSTCFNMRKEGYTVHVFSNCVTSYDLKKLPEMLAYYADKGCDVKQFMKSSNTVEVLFGTPADIGSWMELVREVRWDFPGLETEEAIKEHQNTVLKFMSQNRALCVKNQDRVVGVILFSRRHNMICCLAVRPDCRKRGIASALLKKALSELDREKDITVSTFRENDEKGPAPRALYRKFGFVEGDLTEEFGNPSQVFTLHGIIHDSE